MKSERFLSATTTTLMLQNESIRTEQSKFSEDLIALYDNNNCFKCAKHFFQFWLGSCLFWTVSTNKLINKKQF